MIDKEWKNEYFNDYVLWLEGFLYYLLKEKCDNISSENVKEVFESLHIEIDYMYSGIDDCINFFLNKDNKEPDEIAWLVNMKCIDNDPLVILGFDMLKNKNDKIIIEKERDIEALKIFMSECLYHCGYTDALNYQEKFLKGYLEKYCKTIDQNDVWDMLSDINNKEEQGDMDHSKSFDIKVDNENMTVFYGTLRGNTGWYIKNSKNVSAKISKNNKGEYYFGKKKRFITDEKVISCIKKDYPKTSEEIQREFLLKQTVVE